MNRRRGTLPQPAGLTRVRLFTPTAGRRRNRRAADVILAVGAAGLLVVAALAAHPPSGFERALIDLFGAVPDFLDVLWELAIALLAVWAGAIVIATLVRRRFGVLVDLVLATTVALGILGILRHAMATGDPTVVPVVLVVGCAMVGSARPHLGQPFRRLGRWLVVGGAASSVLLGHTTPLGAIAAMMVGVLAAALDHLALGTDDGRPDEATVARALADLGIEAHSLTPVGRQTSGVFTLEAVEHHEQGDRDLVVKIYGRDAWDAQLLMRAWRALWYRNVDAVAASRVQQVEHEAFVTLLAARMGVPAPGVLTAGPTLNKDAILVLEGVGSPMTDAGAERLAALWELLDTVHAGGLAIRDLSPSNLSIQPSGAVAMADLSTATSAPTDDEVTIDRSQLVVTSAILAGADVALDAAHRHLGDEGLAEVVPYLQPAALGPSLRRELRESPEPSVDVGDLRARAAELASVSEPDVAELRRVSVGSLVRMGLLSFAAYSIISLLGGLDFAELQSQLSGGTYSWAVLGLAVAQLTYVAQAVSTQGASPRMLPAGPLTALQAAISFVNLAVPSTAARVVMIIRFFERQGVNATAAVTISAVESFAGFVVQILMLVLLLVPGFVELELDIDFPPGVSRLVDVLLILVGVALLCVAVLALVPSLRRRALARVRPHLREVGGVVRALRTPLRLVELLGGNLACQLLLAAALAMSTRVFGVHISLAEALVVFIIASLFGGMMPVPGGIGVTEAALIAGLVAIGVADTTAFAAAITFRILTFYLPPAWGWFAYRWLQQNDYL